jgi:choline dehydrogenase
MKRCWGDNLQDHALLYLQYQTRDPTQPVPTQTMLTGHNGLRPDQVSLHLFPYGPIASETRPVLCLLVGVMQPLSRGWLKLSSQDPRGTPQIDPGLLTRAEDLDTMTAGVTLARRIAGIAPLEDHVTGEKWPGPNVRTKDENRRRGPSVSRSLQSRSWNMPHGSKQRPWRCR